MTLFSCLLNLHFNKIKATTQEDGLVLHTNKVLVEAQGRSITANLFVLKPVKKTIIATTMMSEF